ncbi:HNH endonuclease [Candidatus Palauibacter sp.]|uniref:HNH endonuclease n=1 Tax=Candidatus Palauibacter sp. TaxID=3101350 RepID=UPI003B0264DF
MTPSRGRAGSRRRRRILQRDGHRCRECGFPGALEVHHVVPVHAGGGEEDANLETICRGCHLGRHKRPEDEDWRAMVEDLARPS